MDGKLLEQYKENIQPLPNGRPALKLGLVLKNAPSKSSLAREREEHESRLASDDSDDPLQDYIDYICWVQTNYPQGNSGDSGLLNILERCTLCFRDTTYYKNDARYLKVWLTYAGFSDLPKDIFVYLAKKDIGLQLALYYEEFAKYLEFKSQVAEAREIYEVGIEREARPLPRLLRSFQHFNSRTALNTINDDSSVNNQALVLRQPSASSIALTVSHKRQKLLIHTDEKPMAFKEIVFSQINTPDFALISGNTRENSMPITPWDGAIVEQKERPEKVRPPKFEVFRDEETNESQPTSMFELSNENGEIYSLVKQTGKKTEKLCINLNLFYPQLGEEFCLSELLAKAARSKRSINKNYQKPKFEKPSKKKESGLFSSTQLDPYVEQNHTFTIPLRDEDTTKRPNSPTITMMSRMATNDVLKMFNDAAHNTQLEDELFKTFEETTDYEGFATETMDLRHNHNTKKDNFVSDAPSSPFLERPE